MGFGFFGELLVAFFEAVGCFNGELLSSGASDGWWMERSFLGEYTVSLASAVVVL